MLEHVFIDKIIQQAEPKPIPRDRNPAKKSSTCTPIKHWTTTLTCKQNSEYP